MKRFKFSFESLLKMKISVEKQRKAELSIAQYRLREFVKRLSEMEQVYEDCRVDFNELAVKGASTLDFSVYQNGFEALRDQMARQQKKIDVAEEEVRRVQRALTEVRKERKMLEKLKEHKLEEYKYESAREDARIIDDYISYTVDTKR